MSRNSPLNRPWARGGLPPPLVINFHDNHGQFKLFLIEFRLLVGKKLGTIKDGGPLKGSFFSSLAFVLGKMEGINNAHLEG